VKEGQCCRGKGKGQYRLRLDSVLGRLQCVILERTTLLEVGAFLWPVPVAFELEDVLGQVNRNLPFCFYT